MRDLDSLDGTELDKRGNDGAQPLASRALITNRLAASPHDNDSEPPHSYAVARAGANNF